jgi:hypothetical protein
MDQEIIVDAIKHNTAQQSRIADAMEEIIRMVKEDQERSRAYMEREKNGLILLPLLQIWGGRLGVLEEV